MVKHCRNGGRLMIAENIHSWTCRSQIYLWEQTIEKDIPISGIKNYHTYFNMVVMKTAALCHLLDNVMLFLFRCSRLKAAVMPKKYFISFYRKRFTFVIFSFIKDSYNLHIFCKWNQWPVNFVFLSVVC